MYHNYDSIYVSNLNDISEIVVELMLPDATIAILASEIPQFILLIWLCIRSRNYGLNFKYANKPL